MRFLLLDEAQLRVGSHPIVNVSVMLTFCVLIMCVHTGGWTSSRALRYLMM